MTISRRRTKNQDKSTEPGQDSFLDVVANLIGILIILVMLIGSQAQTVWQQLRQQKQETDAEVETLESGIATTRLEVGKLKSENNELEKAIEYQEQLTSRARQERDRIQLAVHSVEESIKAKKAEFTQDEKLMQEWMVSATSLRDELAKIQGQTQSLELTRPKLGVIDHLPTPIAKTVFGEEVHFRLLNGRLVHVPLDELVTLMRSEWKVKAKKLVQTPSTIETVGPIDNFRLQYKLIIREQIQRTEHGAIRSMVPGLERFVILPTRTRMGEEFKLALQPNSQFSRKISTLDPEDTTISVWVYPDSFEHFNELKRYLYEKGFLCAGWPLPANQPISGSPNGFRTAAQ